MNPSKPLLLSLGVLLPGALHAWGGPPPVQTTPVISLDLAREFELPGTALPFRKTVVAAAEEGIVAERVRGYFSVPVETGDVLVRLEATRAKALLAEAEARAAAAQARLDAHEAGERKEIVQEARAEVRRAVAAQKEAASNLARIQPLERRKAATRDQLDQAVRQAAVTKEELSAARSRLARLVAGSRSEEVRQARAAYDAEAARVDYQKKVLADHEVRAPYTGIVDTVHVEVGAWVGKGDKVVDLVDNSFLDLGVLVPEDRIAEVSTGTTAPAVFAGETSPRLGKVVALGPQATFQGRSIPIVVRVPNADGVLRSGMSARVRIPLGASQPRLVVPKDAVLRNSAGETRVVLVVEDAAQPRPVKVGIETQGYFEILEGIALGDQVVVRGNERLQPGQKVAVEP